MFFKFREVIIIENFNRFEQEVKNQDIRGKTVARMTFLNDRYTIYFTDDTYVYFVSKTLCFGNCHPLDDDSRR